MNTIDPVIQEISTRGLGDYRKRRTFSLMPFLVSTIVAILLAAGFFASTVSASIQYNSTDIPKSITDNTTVTSTIVVTDTGTISDVNVELDITHTWDGDLDIFIIAPDGTRVNLANYNGSNGDNFTNTMFDDEAATSISAGMSPFSGAFQPIASLSILDGKSASGIWTLEITDSAGGDTGTLNSWSLDISTGGGGSTYAITETSGTGGSVSCTPNPVNSGSDSVCMITPDSGYAVSDVLVDGVSQGALTSYTFAAVVADHTIEAVFVGGSAVSGVFAYVANSDDGTVSVIDTSTNTVTATVTVGTAPLGVAVSPDGARAYVSNKNDNTISVIDTSTNTVTATVPVGTWPIGVSVTPDGTNVYVANTNGNTVSVIDTSTNTVTATVSVGSYPNGISVTPDGTKVYVTNRTSNTVSVIDTSTNTVTATVPVGTWPIGVSVTPDGANAYVANVSGDSVSVIDTSTNTVTATVPVGFGPQGVSVTPDGTKVYVTISGEATVSVIDTSTNTVTATVPVGANPVGVSVTPDGTNVYVANVLGATVSVIDTSTNMVTSTVVVGNGPNSIGNFIAAIGGSNNTATSITTTFAGGNGSNGNMFDVTATNEITITTIDINTSSTAATTVDVYYKFGTYVGFETDSAAWTQLGSYTVTGAGTDNPTSVDIDDLNIPPGSTYGIYVDISVGGIRYTDGTNTYSNSDLTLTLGVGRGAPAFTGAIYTPRTWNGTIYYTTGGVTTLFSEDWESGIDSAKWKSWGSPVPVLYATEGYSGTQGFDANGDANYQSGATTYQNFDLTELPKIEFWAKGHSSTTNWQNIRVGWSSTTAAAYSGTAGQPAYVGGLITIATENADEFIRYQVGAEFFDEPWVDAIHNDVWMKYSIETNADGTFSFYRDDTMIWSNTTPITLSSYTNQALVVDGRSYGAHHIVDDITVTVGGEGNTPNTIVENAGTGGSVSCTPNPVDSGSDSVCTITPDSGYAVSDVLVDGVSQGTVTSYTFTGVGADHTIDVTFEANGPSSLLYSEALSIIPDAKLIAAVETGATIDLNSLVANATYNATLSGRFAIYEKALNSYTHAGNCTSDDMADDPWPTGVTLRFAVAQTGEIFVGAIGADSDVMTLLAYGGGSAYYNTNDANQIYYHILDWDQRANYMAWLAGDELINHMIVDGLAVNGAVNWDQFWTAANFDLYNGFTKSIWQVYAGLNHQQADYSWYNTDSTTGDQLVREAWSPANTLNANMTMQRNMDFSYSGVLASAVETTAYGDNQNNEEIFLDGVSNGHQYDCGSISRLFTGTTPSTVQINAYSQWSYTGSQYRGAFVADSISATAYNEVLNGVTNPADSFDQNPAPIIYEINPGWVVNADNTAKIVFYHSDTTLSSFEIFIADPDGGNAVQLTNDSFADYNPALSPDSSKIAFESNRGGGERQIYTMNADGTNIVQLTSCTYGCFGPAWSPDGSKIIFAKAHQSNRENTNIYIMDADGTNEQRLTTAAGVNQGFPGFFPSGDKIYFTSGAQYCGACNNLYTLDYPSLTNQIQLTTSGAYYTFLSPDGTQFAGSKYIGSGDVDIQVLNPDGSNLTTIINAGAGNSARGWLPDGSKILYWVDYELHAISPDGINDEVIYPQAVPEVDHAMTVTAGTGGTITPSGAVSVLDGADQTFTIMPDSGYGVADVLVDGVSVGAVTSYTFTGVVADHTIEASFIQQHAITESTGAGGSISCSVNPVNSGGSSTCSITPDSGHIVADVLVDGASQGAVMSYNFTNVTVPHTISATFDQVWMLSVTNRGTGSGAVVADSGTLSWSGVLGTEAYLAGTTVNITGTSDADSSLSWIGCDSVDATGTVCTVAMSADRSVEAVFDRGLNFRANETSTDCPNPTITTHVAVVDQNGDPVTGLDASAFTVTEDGVVQSPITVTSAVQGSGVSIALTMDYSGSMPASDISAMELAATNFVGQMQPGDEASIIKFATLVETTQPFTSEQTLLTTAINNAWAGATGNTAFYDAVFAGISTTSARTGSKAILAMTDGTDNSSSHTLQQVIDYALQENIPVFTIGLGSANQSVLQQMADDTGGQYYYAPTASDLDLIYKTLLNLMRNQYAVSYDTLNPDGQQHTVTVNVSALGFLLTDTRQFVTCSNSGSISGTVVDSQTGVGMAGVTVDLSGASVATVTTDSTGNYSFEGLSDGFYTVAANASGYIVDSISTDIASQASSIVNFALSSYGIADTYRIVLIWGQSPSDLDSHLYIPDGTGCNHIYYGSSGSTTAFPYAELDVDDTTSYGPETISIDIPQQGVYEYWVHNYSGSPDMTTSAAVVKLYDGTSLLATYDIPGSPAGNLGWHVFDLDGSTGVVTSVNALATDLTSANCQNSAVNDHTIIATAGTGGTITPSGAVSVVDGADQTFTITPDSGYGVIAVLVDSVSVGVVTSYTFTDVVANHTVEASFALIISDVDGDGVDDAVDAFPTDPAAAIDIDGDGYPDAWNIGMTASDSTTALTLDVFPSDPAGATDSDSDGLPDEWEVANLGGINESLPADSDNDGLTNLEEYRLNTDPTTDNALMTDTDGDGIPDDVETATGTDPALADSGDDGDGDGFTNLEEYFMATDPAVDNATLTDSDADGIPDVVETANGTDPAVNDATADPDGDGLTNAEEYILATGAATDNRSMTDTDNDGIPDQVEMTSGLDPAVDNSTTDSDGDGISDLVEYKNATIGIGNAALTDTDGDSLPDLWEVANGLDPALSNGAADTDGDGIDDSTEYSLGLSPVDANQPPAPVVVITASGMEALSSDVVNIVINASTDPEGLPVSYTATLYEGVGTGGNVLETVPVNVATGYTPQAALGMDTIYTVVITASDGYAASAGSRMSFVVSNGTIAGDVNYDGMVDGDDLILLKVVFGRDSGNASFNVFADLNDDGTIDGSDLGLLAPNFGLYR